MTTARELVNAATAAGAKLATARGAGRARCVFSLNSTPGRSQGWSSLGGFRAGSEMTGPRS
jgi:hypothetical protein